MGIPSPLSIWLQAQGIAARLPDLAFLPRFNPLGASSRYRCFQFLPELRRSGISAAVNPLFSREYLTFRYGGGGWPLGIMLRDVGRRMAFLRRLPRDIPLWIEKELFPWLPGAVELAFLRGRRFIVDFDDAIHVAYRPFPFLRNKIGSLISKAFEVHAGNEFLLSEFRALQKNTRLFPTVLDPDEYRKRSGRTDPKKLVVGWIGSPLSRSHLESFLPVLESVRDIPVHLACMGAGSSLPTTVPHTLHEWTSQAEKEFCARLDVGIMPLSEGPFGLGKCGFKLLQYMSAGVATVASRSGANERILEHGRCGFLAGSPQEWRKAFHILFHNPSTLEHFGKLGLQRVNEAYSRRILGPVWIEAIRRLVAR